LDFGGAQRRVPLAMGALIRGFNRPGS
jgi:hypothetical protein